MAARLRSNCARRQWKQKLMPFDKVIRIDGMSEEDVRSRLLGTL